MDVELCQAALSLARVRARNARARQDLARAGEYGRIADAIEWLLAERSRGPARLRLRGKGERDG